MGSNSKILIIGGGLTGLSVAYYLKGRSPDLDITVVEREPTFGGLAAGESILNCPIEKAYHHIFLTDSAIIELAEELGVRISWMKSSMGAYRDGKVWPFGSPIDLLRYRPCRFDGRFRTGLVALFLQKYRNWKKLEQYSAREWMEKWCGTSAARSFWHPLLKGKFDVYDRDVSMAWLWARIHTRANSRQPGKDEMLGYFEPGFAEVTEKLTARLLESDVRLECSCDVQLEQGSGGKSFKVNGSSETFDRVLFTGSSSGFSRVFRSEADSEIKQVFCDRCEEIRYIGAICYIFATEQSIGDHYWVNINEDGAPFLVFIKHTSLVGSERFGGKHVYYIGAYLDMESEDFKAAEQDLKNRWLDYLNVMFPDFDRGKIEEERFYRFRNAQHIVDCDYGNRLLPYETPFEGVYLANFSQVYPEDRGTNFAVNEGKKVSRIVAGSLRPTPCAGKDSS